MPILYVVTVAVLAAIVFRVELVAHREADSNKRELEQQQANIVAICEANNEIRADTRALFNAVIASPYVEPELADIFRRAQAAEFAERNCDPEQLEELYPTGR